MGFESVVAILMFAAYAVLLSVIRSVDAALLTGEGQTLIGKSCRIRARFAVAAVLNAVVTMLTFAAFRPSNRYRYKSFCGIRSD